MDRPCLRGLGRSRRATRGVSRATGGETGHDDGGSACGTEVVLVPDTAQPDPDRYDRLLRHVEVPSSGIDVDRELWPRAACIPRTIVGGQRGPRRTPELPGPHAAPVPGCGARAPGQDAHRRSLRSWRRRGRATWSSLSVGGGMTGWSCRGERSRWRVEPVGAGSCGVVPSARPQLAAQGRAEPSPCSVTNRSVTSTSTAPQTGIGRSPTRSTC